MESSCTDLEPLKVLSGRKRKKLYNKLRSQMEFYFSDSNLAKDKFLYNLICQNSEGYVDIEVFKTFNKIKALSEDTNFIVESLSKSNILEVDGDKLKVRRKTPVEISKDFDACTLYVEGLPAYADHKWIRNIFENFGTVDYINIPRFNISQRIKGFAFIEFSSPESVLKACEFYKISSKNENTTSEDEKVNLKEETKRKSDDMGNKKSKRIKSISIEVSVKNENENLQTDARLKCENSDTEKKSSPFKSKKKRKFENTDSKDSEPVKKVKSSSNENIMSNGKSQQPDSLSDSDNVNNIMKAESTGNLANLTENNSAKEASGESDTLKVKKKRKHLKKHRNRHERPTLRVMSKSDWKAYRNKYLDLQRTTMSYLKKQILLEAKEMREQDTSTKVEHVPRKELTFQPGVIIKVKLSKAIENSTEIKEHIKTSAAVAYIDAPLGSHDICLRCHTAEDATTILQDKKLHHIGNAELLTGTEEDEYWKKIKSDREAKLSCPVVRKRRGRDKLIAKASKLIEQKNKHIYFDE